MARLRARQTRTSGWLTVPRLPPEDVTLRDILAMGATFSVNRQLPPMPDPAKAPWLPAWHMHLKDAIRERQRHRHTGERRILTWGD